MSALSPRPSSEMDGGGDGISMEALKSVASSQWAASELEITPATLRTDTEENNEKGSENDERYNGLRSHDNGLSERLIFMRPTAAYRYNVDKRRVLRNNMLAGVGLLEFANGGDFAANVWNAVPAPVYALVLMALGGTFALFVSYFAFKDATLSWNNVVLLRDERRFLRRRQAAGVEREIMRQDEDVRLDMNFRESGTEMADRFGMDIIMGIAAVLVGVGTLMAMGGENRKVYLASNLLSGYIGNGPAAFWGLANVAWCVFVWRRVRRHSVAGRREFRDSQDPVWGMLRTRTRLVMGHAAVYGVTGFVAGVASLITSTRWWGYVILAPCIVASIACNHVFRHFILYKRVSIQEMPLVDKMSIIRQLRRIVSIREILNGESSSHILRLNMNPVSLPSLLECILELGLFEQFCIRVIRDPTLVGALFGNEREELIMDSRWLATVEGPDALRLLEIAQACLTLAELEEMSSRHRETFLVETLGCLLCVSSRRDAYLI